VIEHPELDGFVDVAAGGDRLLSSMAKLRTMSALMRVVIEAGGFVTMRVSLPMTSGGQAMQRATVRRRMRRAIISTAQLWTGLKKCMPLQRRHDGERRRENRLMERETGARRDGVGLGEFCRRR